MLISLLSNRMTRHWIRFLFVGIRCDLMSLLVLICWWLRPRRLRNRNMFALFLLLVVPLTPAAMWRWKSSILGWSYFFLCLRFTDLFVINSQFFSPITLRSTFRWAQQQRWHSRHFRATKLLHFRGGKYTLHFFFVLAWKQVVVVVLLIAEPFALRSQLSRWISHVFDRTRASRDGRGHYLHRIITKIELREHKLGVKCSGKVPTTFFAVKITDSRRSLKFAVLVERESVCLRWV